MIFLIDEDIDHAVAGLLARRHDVRHIAEALGSGVKDPVVEQYARSQDAILVTSDGPFARRLRQRDRRWKCLWLRDLVTEERVRVEQLLDVIEREAAVGGETFWMEIRQGSFHVHR